MNIPIYVGFDPREAAAYHTFCQSVMNHRYKRATPRER